MIVTVHLDMKRDGKSFTMVLPTRAHTSAVDSPAASQSARHERPVPLSRRSRKNSAQFHPRGDRQRASLLVAAEEPAIARAAAVATAPRAPPDRRPPQLIA